MSSFWVKKAGAQEKKYIFAQEKMGSPFTITAYASDSVKLAAAVKGALQLTDSLVAIYSDYLPGSELNRLSATAGKNINQVVSKPLLDILLIAQRASRLSDGAFDVTLGALTHLWRDARKKQQMPAEAAISTALAASGYQKMHIDSAKSTVRLDVPGMKLDLGGIAQGYIGQQVVDFLTQQGFGNVLVDVSGDLVAGDSPPGRSSWIIGINKPEQHDELLPEMLNLSRGAVTTSGDLYQFMEFNGKRYSHLIDPKTGLGLTGGRYVTVLAKDGTTADWLTKAASILAVDKALALVETVGNAEALIIINTDGKINTFSSSGFNNYIHREGNEKNK